MRNRVVLFLLTACVLYPQGVDYVKAHYTKHEFEVPMRDGVKLYTAVYTPKDTSQRYPILLNRTPYSLRPYGVDQYRENIGPWAQFAREGYIIVYQDVRGRWASQGEFLHVRPHKPAKSGPKDIDESTDTFDTIDWLVKNIPGHNGRVGMWGISYPGFYAAMGAIDAHPALAASSPQAPVAEWFIGDDFHHNGALFLAHAFNFLINVDMPHPEPTKKGVPNFDHDTPNGYEFFLRMGVLSNADEKFFKGKSAFWKEMMQHPNYDEYWKARNVIQHLKSIKPAIMTVGGWFDAEDIYGPLRMYEFIEKNNPRGQNMIVMGPWDHGGWSRGDGDRLGNAMFHSKTAQFYREQIELPFFEYHLKGKGEMKLPEAYMFETGVNEWRRHDAWPPKPTRERRLYYHPGGKLSWDPPTDANAFDEYPSDPMKPVPFIDYVAIGMTREYMTDDQRFASTRPDVLVYQSDPLTEDIVIAGPFTASLNVSITGTDADFVVKLIDVYPDNFPDPDPNPKAIRMGGYQQLLRGEPFRGRFRNGFDKPQAFEPGKATKVEFELPDIYHTFRRDHRIMVQVQSSWFPLVDRNPQKFVDIYNARESDFQKATHRVYRSQSQPSYLRVLTRQ
ncbi:MAG: CocE/NonD family hydrolase [Acidimicrobiia bacterium]|nr:CocE/NonD family hydrolase [Acidimicrobiia bacterium]